MVKVLIIDDDTKRSREIAKEIACERVSVEFITTKQEALRLMSQKQYDLIILDIMLPDDMISIDPSESAGMEILNTIENTTGIKKPANILGLTSGDDVYNNIKEIFDSKLIPLFSWNHVDNKWKTQIKNKVQYLVRMDSQRAEQAFADIAVITAVEEEYNAALSLSDKWERVIINDDPGRYQLADIDIGERKKKVVLVKLPEMGMTAATCITTKVLKVFSPSKVFMIGICGGIRGKVEIGDIIVATSTWDYGSGKIKPRIHKNDDETYYEFESSPNQISVLPNVLSNIDVYKKEILSEIIDDLNNSYRDSSISPELHLSPMPSGASVICDNKLFEEIIKPQHRKCLGLDMETYGVYFSCRNVYTHPIEFLSIKCVSDFADIEKNDDYHGICCYIIADFLKKLIVKCD